MPYPPNKGDKIRSFHMLEYLAARFSIHLGFFVDDPLDEIHISELKAYCAELFWVPLTRGTKFRRAARSLALGQSITEGCYRDRRMSDWVRHTLNVHDIRDVFVFCSAVAPYISDYIAERRVVLDMVDIDSEKWGAYSQSRAGVLRPVFRYEQRQLHKLERRIGAASDRILFVSQAEADAFAALAPELSGKLLTLQNGVDCGRFDPSEQRHNPFPPQQHAIVFTGAMDYPPNVDAVLWFAEEMLPSIRRRHHDAAFWVVGSNPSSRLVRVLSRRAVQVTGTVDDIRHYLAHAKCIVAPLRVARGVQNKVLEAMAMGKPVVATPAALEGLGVVHRREIMAATTADEFAEFVSGVLAGRWQELGPAAREYVAREHRWSDHLKMLNALFEREKYASDFRNPSRPLLHLQRR